MPADIYSNTLGVLMMGTGNDNNSWGTNANASVFQIFEDAIANVLTSTVTGGTLDLSGSPPPAAASQVRHAALNFTGSLGSNQLVKVPNLTKRWLVFNGTSGAFVLQMQTPSGSPILIPQGTFCDVWCSGANTLFRIGARTGEIFTHGGTSVPAGAVACDNTAYSRTIYSELYAKIGTTWGVGNGTTTFNAPNFTGTGRFLRSSGPSAVGTYQSNTLASHTHTGSVTVSGSNATNIENQAHNHEIVGTTGGMNSANPHSHTGSTRGGTTGAGGWFGNSNQLPNYSGASTDATDINHTHSMDFYSQTEGQNHTHNFSLSSSGSFTTDATGGSETRPEAAVVLMCIWV